MDFHGAGAEAKNKGGASSQVSTDAQKSGYSIQNEGCYLWSQISLIVREGMGEGSKRKCRVFAETGNVTGSQELIRSLRLLQ